MISRGTEDFPNTAVLRLESSLCWQGGDDRIDVKKQIKTKLSKVTVTMLGVVLFFDFGRKL